jgi:hypothetical protein
VANEAVSELPGPTSEQKPARIKHHSEVLTGTTQKKISGARNSTFNIDTV